MLPYLLLTICRSNYITKGKSFPQYVSFFEVIYQIGVNVITFFQLQMFLWTRRIQF